MEAMVDRGYRVSGIIFATALVCMPLAASAATAVQTVVPFGAGVGAGLLLSQALNNSANNACKGCQNVDATKPNYCQAITCSTISNGYTVTGKCGAPGECRATSAQGLGGTTINLGTVLQVVGLLATLSQLSQQNAAGVPPGYATPGAACTTWYSSATPSSDPCAIYNGAPVSSAIAGTPISDFGETNAPISDALLNLAHSRNESAPNIGSQLKDLAHGTSSNAQASSSAYLRVNDTLSADASGIVQAKNAGATIAANFRHGFTEVAGFFGSSFSGNAQQSFASRLCTNRPWASGFLAKILPPWLLDGVCAKLGYQVGAVEMQGPSVEKRPVTVEKGSVPIQKSAPAPPLEADIWAEPASVRLSSRTKIFWSSRSADSCTIAGPSFEQSSLQGGGATVPITGPTTFTITCLAGENTVSDSVTVNLSI